MVDAISRLYHAKTRTDRRLAFSLLVCIIIGVFAALT